MHKVLKAFPCSFDGITSTELLPGYERDFGSMAEGLKMAGLIEDVAVVPGLRDDGPTVAEYVAAGYLASNYPPGGYASRSTPEEIESAVTAENAAKQAATEAAAKKAEEEAKAKAFEAMRTDLSKQTVAQLHDLAKAESVGLDVDDKKAEIIDKIVAARLASAE